MLARQLPIRASLVQDDSANYWGYVASHAAGLAGWLSPAKGRQIMPNEALEAKKHVTLCLNSYRNTRRASFDKFPQI